MNNLFYKTIIIFSATLILAGILVPNLVVSEVGPQDLPQNLEEAKQKSKKGVEVAGKNLPQAIKDIWSKEVIPIWEKMWSGTKSIWKEYIQPGLHRFWYSQAKPKIQSLLDRIRNTLGMEVEKRKPQIKEEFEKEKQEMEKDVKKKVPSKNWWERFKGLLQ